MDPSILLGVATKAPGHAKGPGHATAEPVEPGDANGASTGEPFGLELGDKATADADTSGSSPDGAGRLAEGGATAEQSSSAGGVAPAVPVKVESSSLAQLGGPASAILSAARADVQGSSRSLGASGEIRAAGQGSLPTTAASASVLPEVAGSSTVPQAARGSVANTGLAPAVSPVIADDVSSRASPEEQRASTRSAGPGRSDDAVPRVEAQVRPSGAAEVSGAARRENPAPLSPAQNSVVTGEQVRSTRGPGTQIAAVTATSVSIPVTERVSDGRRSATSDSTRTALPDAAAGARGAINNVTPDMANGLRASVRVSSAGEDASNRAGGEGAKGLAPNPTRTDDSQLRQLPNVVAGPKAAGDPPGPGNKVHQPAIEIVQPGSNRSDVQRAVFDTSPASASYSAAATTPANANTAQVNAVVPIASSAALPIRERDFTGQIAQAAAARGNGGVVNLMLDPPELGRVEIVMEIAEQGVRATLTAERQATGDMIRRHAEMLAQQFQDAGFDDIDLAFHDHHAFGDADARNEENLGSDGQTPSLGEGPNAQPTRVLRSPASDHSIDIRL